MKYLIALALIVPTFSFAQPLKIRKDYSGMFSLGVRTTVSAFNHGEKNNTGVGYGGQFRLQIAERINTDWYADYITSKPSENTSRTDYHIGWSVLFYPTKKQNSIIKPYILAGHCFDRSEIYANNDRSNWMRQNSSAVQAGAGFHLNLSERVDLSFVTQYMFHLGEDIHYHEQDGIIHFEKHKGTGLEGHLLFHVGINYKIVDIWGRS